MLIKCRVFCVTFCCLLATGIGAHAVVIVVVGLIALFSCSLTRSFACSRSLKKKGYFCVVFFLYRVLSLSSRRKRTNQWKNIELAEISQLYTYVSCIFVCYCCCFVYISNFNNF